MGELLGYIVGSKDGSEGAIELGSADGAKVGIRVGRFDGFLLGFFDGRALVGAYVGFVGHGRIQIDAPISQYAAGLQQSLFVLQPYAPLDMQFP